MLDAKAFFEMATVKDISRFQRSSSIRQYTIASDEQKRARKRAVDALSLQEKSSETRVCHLR